MGPGHNMPFGISFVAGILGLSGEDLNGNRESYYITCPFCGRKKKLNINLRKDTWHCPACGEGGGMVKLYAMCREISHKEAIRDLYQVRHYMAVTGLNRFIILACYGFDDSKVIPVTVYRDKNIEEKMIEQETAFWNSHVIPRVKPEEALMRKEDLKKVQKSLFDPSREKEEMPSEADEFLKSYSELSSEKKNLEAKAKRLEGKINCVVAEICRISSGAPLSVRKIDDESYYEVINRVASRTTLDSDRVKLNYPDVYRECKKVSMSEQTLVRVKKYKDTDPKGA